MSGGEQSQFERLHDPPKVGEGGTRYAVGLVATGGLYLVAGIAGLAVPFTASNISPIWPASGVALGRQGSEHFTGRGWKGRAMGAADAPLFAGGAQH